MSSLFVGKKGLRSQYYSLTEAEVNATTSQDDAKLICILRHQARIFLLDNGLNAEIQILLAHPDADSELLDVSLPAGQQKSYRLPWVEIPGQKPLNFDISATTGLSLDVGTKVYIRKLGAASTNSQKIRLITWG
jgi:hypothetical protein